MTLATLIAPASIGDHVLPTGWDLATIGDLFDIQQGKALSAAARTAAHRYPFLRTSNVLWGRVDLSTVDSMGMSDTERSRLLLSPGDLLVCEGGDIGRAAIWNGELADCYFQNHIHRLRPRDNFTLPEFYAYWLQYAFTRLGIYAGAGTKTTIANLSGGRLAALEVPLPPLDEQRRISRILSTVRQAEKVAKLVDGASYALRDSLRELLFGQYDWTYVELGDVAVIRSGGTPSRSEEAYWGGDIPWVKTGEIDYGVIREATEHITKLGLDNSSAQIYPSGTILLAMYGDGVTRGRVAILGLDAAINQACAAIVPYARLSTEFLYQYLAYAYEELRAIGHGAHQKNLSASLLKRVRVPVPSEAEQATVAGALATIDWKISTGRRVATALQGVFDGVLYSCLGKLDSPK